MADVVLTFNGVPRRLSQGEKAIWRAIQRVYDVSTRTLKEANQAIADEACRSLSATKTTLKTFSMWGALNLQVAGGGRGKVNLWSVNTPEEDKRPEEDWPPAYALAMELAEMVRALPRQKNYSKWREQGAQYVEMWIESGLTDDAMRAAARACAENMAKGGWRQRAHGPKWLQPWMKRQLKIIGPQRTPAPWKTPSALLTSKGAREAAAKAGLSRAETETLAFKVVKQAATTSLTLYDWAAHWAQQCAAAAREREALRQAAEAVVTAQLQPQSAPHPEPSRGLRPSSIPQSEVPKRPPPEHPPPERPPPKPLTAEERAAARAEGEEIIARLTGRRRP